MLESNIVILILKALHWLVFRKPLTDWFLIFLLWDFFFSNRIFVRSFQLPCHHSYILFQFLRLDWKFVNKGSRVSHVFSVDCQEVFAEFIFWHWCGLKMLCLCPRGELHFWCLWHFSGTRATIIQGILSSRWKKGHVMGGLPRWDVRMTVHKSPWRNSRTPSNLEFMCFTLTPGSLTQNSYGTDQEHCVSRRLMLQ